ncbi:PAB1-binding protein 1 [Ogataea parapolymorpha DL-1]|uniref:PAB1-binding protein 1 n=1 Tax=Ogataea parapolymorpha (strain ATCC 26012 / BCRC 20466 / JCM 22074 / NRRL Y-7560 / DL-1) TaxID=871575 RepID=W1QBA7_OGAPD|nr:PAB1-binding protein 1 [Ogataea parapolymorpha DL-1]ESW97613.1 PAB1-binding protein 1 [Ogataea parapolymorpha DL-1]
MTSRGSQSNNPSGSKFTGGNQHRRTGSKNWSHINVSSAPNYSASTFAANGRKANSAAQVGTTQGNQPAYHLANSAQDQEASLRHMNDRLLFGLIRSIGCKSRITTNSGATYDGILYTSGDITDSGVGLILKYPQLKKGSFTPSEEVNNKAELPETLIFSEKDILKMEFEDVDFEPIQQSGKPRLNTSGRSFRTDIDISANSAFHERELQKWVPDEDIDARLTEGLGDADSNVHWDQFEVNERKFAREIESQGHNGNIHLAEERGIIVDDSGVDEEDKYSGVAREPASQNEGDALLLGMLRANTKDHKTELRSTATGKYVPPRQRGANFHGDPAIVTSSATEHRKDATLESSVGLDAHDHGSSDHQTHASHSERLKNTTTESRKFNHQNEINSLREFSATFKVPSKIPPDLLPILSKDKTPTPILSKKKMDPRTAPTFKMNPNSVPFSPSFSSSRNSPALNSGEIVQSPQQRNKKEAASFFPTGKSPKELPIRSTCGSFFNTKFNVLIKARIEYEEKNETKNVLIINIEKPFATPPTWPSTVEESYKMAFSKQPEWIGSPATIPPMQKRMYQVSAQPFPMMAPPPQQHPPVPQPVMMAQPMQMDPHNMHMPQPTFVVPQFQQPQFIPFYQPPPSVPQMAYGIPQNQNLASGAIPVSMRQQGHRNSRNHYNTQQQLNARGGNGYKF